MDISDRAYYQKVRELFLLAQKTIDLSIEAISVKDSPGDPVSVLIEDLITAQKRGVRVRLFLNTFAPASGTQGSLFLHDDILWVMRRGGIEIHFVSPAYHLKDQLIIIDEKQVLEGGLRWRKEDLESSLGSATLLESEPLANQKRLRLEFLPLWDVEQKRLEQTEGNVGVPVYLIREMRYFPKMVLHDDGDAIKVYLSLLRLFYQVQDVHLNAVYEELSHDIPADEFYEPTAAAFQVIRTIERLEEYGLIQIERKDSDRARIRMIFPSQNDAMIKVPIFFFQEGFSKTLTPPAIFAYFVITYKTQISGEAPVWLGSERNVEQDFPMAEAKFRAGVSELRERNLVEVFPFQLQKSYRKLSSLEYRYLLNPVPTMSQRLQAWDRLREEFGDEQVRRAQDLAKILGEPEDPKVIAVYLDLLKNFKAEDVMAFTERLSMLPPDSTPAQMDYLRTLLEHESQNTSLATF